MFLFQRIIIIYNLPTLQCIPNYLIEPEKLLNDYIEN